MPNLSAWVFVALAVVQLAHAAPQGISRSARCGPSFGLTCKGSSFGNCCSKYGYCGSTSNHCDSKNGCQTGWGSCSSASSLAATSKISKNGKCGGGSGATCQGSTYGSCCSQYGYCGSTADYCGTKCNPLFGTCSTSLSSTFAVSLSPSALPSPVLVVSTNARCGDVNGASPKSMTCRGSKYGSCCSQYGYCGSSKDYCNAGCQSMFGDCNAISPSSPSKLSTQPVVSSTTTLAVTIVTSSTTLANSLSSVPSAAVTVVSQTSSSTAVSLASVLSSLSTATPVLSTITSASPSTPAVPSETLKCKEIGRLRDTEFLANIGFTRQVTLEQCTATCLAAPACTYFIFRNGADCLLFGGNVATSGPVVPSPDYNLYERGCFATVASSSTYLSTTSVIPATSSSSLESPSALATPVSPEPLCGTSGYLTNQLEEYEKIYNGDVQKCAEQCLGSARCTYFIIQSRRVCLLHDDIIVQAGPFEPSGPYLFYERACFAPVASSSTPLPTTDMVPSTSSSSSEAPSASPTPAVSAPLCDVRGSPEHAQNMFIGAYRSDEVGACSSRCFTSPDCTYFILQSGSCSLYKGVLAEGGRIIPNNYNRLYEKNCFQTVSSSSSAFPSSPQTTTSSTSSATPISSTPTPSTPSATPSPTPTALRCNEQGYPTSKLGAENTIPISEAEFCGRICRLTSTCTYFVFSPSLCTLFNGVPAPGPFVPNPGSILYEKGCFK